MIPDFPNNIRISLAKSKLFLLRPDVALSLPCWMSQLNWDSQKSQRRKKIQLCQSYSCIMRKVWYHQIWIQTYFVFIVFNLMLMRIFYSYQICARRKCALTAITIPRWNRHLWSPKDGKPYWPFCMFFWSLGSQPLLWWLYMTEFLIWKSIHLCLILFWTMFLIFLG